MLCMADDRPGWAPESIDLDRPNAARVYDYLLGGAANFETDRVFADKLLEMMPQVRLAARANRAFLRRAVRFCVNAGITQFLDIGSGVPTVGNVHEIAPEARVLYVDNEPVAVAHSELLLGDNKLAKSMLGDLTNPGPILASPAIDYSQPVALLMVAVLHFIPDDLNPREAVARYVSALASGSYVVVSHAVEQPSLEGVDKVDRLYERSANPGVRRTEEEVLAFLDGLDLVEPGLVWTPQWRPDSPDEAGDDPASSLVMAAVAHKP